MTGFGADPIPSITEATLTDIAANGIWASGPTVNTSVVALARALIAAV
jgi:hypothetical protein